jgi:hypothetical protein
MDIFWKLSEALTERFGNFLKLSKEESAGSAWVEARAHDRTKKHIQIVLPSVEAQLSCER